MPQRHSVRYSRNHKRCDVEHTSLDLYHNRDTPCCRLLHDVAVEIRDNRSTLANVLWLFLLKRHRDDEAISATSMETNDTDTLPIKKKKRKKKKKAMQDLKIPADDERKSTSTDVEIGDGHVNMSKIVDVDQDASAQKLHVSQRTRHDHFELFIGCLLADVQEQASHFSVEHLPSLTARLRTIRISHDKLLHALNDIACQSCRRSLDYFVAHHDQVKLVQREEATFDYIALEEGTLPGARRNEAVFRLLKQTPDGAFWELHFADSNDRDITLQHILTLMQEFVLARGFSQDDRMRLMGYKVIELQTSAINSIGMSAISKYREIEALIRDAKIEVNEKNLECRRTEVNSSANLDYNFDAFPRLSEIDTKLDILLQNLQRHIIQPLTRSYFATAENMHDDALKQYVQELCYSYGHCIHSCVEHIAGYEERFFLLANRHGILPRHYLSTTARELYRSMLLKKIQAVHDLIERLEKICHSTVQTGISDIDTSSQFVTSLMYRLLIQQSFCDQLNNDREHSPSNFEQADLVWECFFESLSSYASTVHGSSVDMILKEHDRVREEVGATLKQAISLMEAAHHGPVNFQLTSNSNVERGRSNQHVLLFRFLESMDRVHPLKSFRLSLACGLRICTNAWIDSRSSCQSPSIGSSTFQRIQMPFKLMKVMANDGEDALASCYGGTEETRVACILVSLFFRQLSYICDDWRAAIAEQELLQSMGSDGGNIMKAADSNAKTKRRQKTKRLFSSDRMQDEESARHSRATSILQNDKESERQATSETTTPAMQSINETGPKESTSSRKEPLQCTLDDNSTENLSEHNKLNSRHDHKSVMPKPNRKNDIYGESEQEDFGMAVSQTNASWWRGVELEADSSVGVLDADGGFQLARDFLAARLQDLDEASGT